MKRLILIIVVVMCGSPLLGQKMEIYTASNGVTYRKGDIVTLGRGSNPNGNFVYLQISGLMMSLDAEENQLSSSIAGLGVEVKAIRRQKLKGIEKVYFSVGGGNITNYLLLIEDAISVCEVVPCNDKTKGAEPSSTTKVDQLKDLKDLLDNGAVSQEEYDKMKSEIINQ